MSDNFEKPANIAPGLEENHNIREPLSRRDSVKNYFSSAVIGTVGYLSYRYSHIPFSEAREAAGGIFPGIEEGTSIVELAKAQVGILAQDLLLTAQTCVEIGGAVAAVGGMGNVAVRGYMAVIIGNHQESRG